MNMHCLPRCVTKWMWLYRQFQVYHLVRRRIANNNCVSASILLLSKAKSREITVWNERKKCAKRLWLQYLCQIHSVPGGSKVFYENSITEQQIEILVGALCVSPQLLHSDTRFHVHAYFCQCISAFLYCLLSCTVWLNDEKEKAEINQYSNTLFVPLWPFYSGNT